ncbi:protein-tyrosine phosphatase [Ruminococcaceae bacterium YRB3002]|nr:protein-tyrosine phosphatase [Ruminococcaceae bacterium YRB3002]
MTSYDPAISTIDIKGSLNLRDMGGMPISGGITFPYKVFVRSGNLSEVGQDGLKALKDYGITTVIDLRSKPEVVKWGNPAIDDPDIDFHNVPLFLGDPDQKEDPTMVFLRTHPLGDFYVQVMEGLSGEIIKVLDILANTSGVALFHCAHGKDRTGIIAAILYLLAGASQEDIIRNYEFSYEYIRWFLDPLIEKREDVMKHTLRSDRINMEIMLGYINNRYDGSILAYLKESGITDDTLNRLYSKMGVAGT